MAFKGNPHDVGAGRKKGTPNKKTEELHEVCERLNLNVFESMATLAVAETDPSKKFERLKEIAQYLYPKRKAIEHSGEIKNPHMEKSLEQLEAEVRKKLK